LTLIEEATSSIFDINKCGVILYTPWKTYQVVRTPLVE